MFVSGRFRVSPLDKNISKNLQKQTSRDFIKKTCSENMKKMYRRRIMLKCYFNKVAYWKHT